MVVSWGVGRPEEKEKDGAQQVTGAVTTHTFIKFTVLYGHVSWHPEQLQ